MPRIATNTPTVSAPRHLSPKAKGIFRKLVADFALEGQPEAVQLLRLALEAIDRGDQAREVIEREGLTVEDRYGQIRPHPAVGIEKDSAIRAARIFRELGLGPEDSNDPRIPRRAGAPR